MFTEETKKQVLEEYYNNINTSIICEKYNCTDSSIYNWIRQTNNKPKGKWSTKYFKNNEFFNNPNTINSYWAGFIAADGHLHKTNKSVQLLLSIIDYNHLEKFKEIVEYTGLIKTRKRRYKENSFQNDICYLYINSAHQWHNDLWNNFCIPSGNKTFNLMFPEQLSYENKLSYIAGYTDGDGSLYLTKNNAITLSFVSGSKEILNGIKNFFDINYYSFEYKNKGLAKLYNYETHFRYKLNGKRVEKIVHDIKLLNLPLLERKWGGLLL